MKVFALFVVLAGMIVGSTGCATPAYSPSERRAQIFRNWDYEAKQAVDDFDHLLLLRPASHLTIWNVQ